MLKGSAQWPKCQRSSNFLENTPFYRFFLLIYLHFVIKVEVFAELFIQSLTKFVTFVQQYHKKYQKIPKFWLLEGVTENRSTTLSRFTKKRNLPLLHPTLLCPCALLDLIEYFTDTDRQLITALFSKSFIKIFNRVEKFSLSYFIDLRDWKFLFNNFIFLSNFIDRTLEIYW